LEPLELELEPQGQEWVLLELELEPLGQVLEKQGQVLEPLGLEWEPLELELEPQGQVLEPLELELEPQGQEWVLLELEWVPLEPELEQQGQVLEPLGLEWEPLELEMEPLELEMEPQGQVLEPLGLEWEPLELEMEPQGQVLALEPRGQVLQQQELELVFLVNDVLVNLHPLRDVPRSLRYSMIDHGRRNAIRPNRHLILCPLLGVEAVDHTHFPCNLLGVSLQLYFAARSSPVQKVTLPSVFSLHSGATVHFPIDCWIFFLTLVVPKNSPVQTILPSPSLPSGVQRAQNPMLFVSISKEVQSHRLGWSAVLVP
jgi:hypothetical protein